VLEVEADNEQEQGSEEKGDGDSTSSASSESAAAETSAPEQPEERVLPPEPEYDEANQALLDALVIYYNNLAAAHVMLQAWDPVISATNKALEWDPKSVKALKRRAMALEKKESYSEALNDQKTLVELTQGKEHKRAVARLEPLAAAKFEEQKTEMLNKLKGLGNTILGKFGMSLDQFQAVQDPETGSYSVNFNQK
jgi:tetratricopeptide (TPR) repeat protein